LILRIVDKFIFALTLILTLQIPQLADHYQQYLSGLYQATQSQVEGYESTAIEFKFADLQSMIDRHLHNTEPSVRADAMQKMQTLAFFAELQEGVDIFDNGHLFDKLLYMLKPTRYETLKGTMANFKMGIPFTISGLGFGIVFGLILNLFMMWPLNRWARRRRVEQA